MAHNGTGQPEESQPVDPQEWASRPEDHDHLTVQGVDIPRTYRKRVLLVSPTMDDLTRARQQLLRAGAPADARVHFIQWPQPATNYYVVATWQEAPKEADETRRSKRRWPSIRGRNAPQ